MTYTAGYSILGNPWHFEPTEHETFDEAKRALIKEMLTEADDAAKSGADRIKSYCDALANAAEDVNLWSENDYNMRKYGYQSSAAGRYVWWIAKSKEDEGTINEHH